MNQSSERNTAGEPQKSLKETDQKDKKEKAWCFLLAGIVQRKTEMQKAEQGKKEEALKHLAKAKELGDTQAQALMDSLQGK